MTAKKATKVQAKPTPSTTANPLPNAPAAFGERPKEMLPPGADIKLIGTGMSADQAQHGGMADDLNRLTGMGAARKQGLFNKPDTTRKTPTSQARHCVVEMQRLRKQKKLLVPHRRAQAQTTDKLVAQIKAGAITTTEP
jgi:hypothetical protein